MTRASIQGTPMTLQQGLTAGWYVGLGDRVLRILTIAEDDAYALQAEDIGTREVFELDYQEIVREAIFAPTLEALREQSHPADEHPPATDLGVPENLLSHADGIIKIVEDVENMVREEEQRALGSKKAFRRTSAVVRACGRLRVSKSTFYAYSVFYRRHDGDRARIASALRRSTFREDGLTKAQTHFADTIIMKFYVRETRPRVSKVWRDADDILKRTGNRWIDPTRCPDHPPRDLISELLDFGLSMEVILSNPEKARLLTSVAMPSKSWFYNRVRWLQSQPDRGKAIVDRRHGKGTWDGEFRAFDTFATRASFPLQYVFADHLLLKVIILDAETRARPDRLWLTALIDAFSRSVLGVALLYETPCIESIQSALQHAIWPKHSELEPGLEEKWPCFGIPQQLSLDNAWAHHSHSLEQLSRAISHNGRYSSIELDFRPPYMANRGGLIERFFGNVSAQIRDLLPGAILSKKPGAVKNAQAQACLLYKDIDKYITQIVLTYQNTRHSELHGSTPNERWVEGVKKTGIPRIPPLTDQTERIFWRRSPETRVISQKGICAFGLHYWSPELNGVPRVGRDGRRIEYRFHYEPADISRLAIFNDQNWIGDVQAKELRLPDGDTRRMSLAELELTKALAVSDVAARADRIQFLEDLSALTQKRLAEKRAAEQGRRRSGKGQASKRDVSALESALDQWEPRADDDQRSERFLSFIDAKK